MTPKVLFVFMSVMTFNMICLCVCVYVCVLCEFWSNLVPGIQFCDFTPAIALTQVS